MAPLMVWKILQTYIYDCCELSCIYFLVFKLQFLWLQSIRKRFTGIVHRSIISSFWIWIGAPGEAWFCFSTAVLQNLTAFVLSAQFICVCQADHCTLMTAFMYIEHWAWHQLADANIRLTVWCNLLLTFLVITQFYIGALWQTWFFE